jgi:hypothetical protein
LAKKRPKSGISIPTSRGWKRDKVVFGGFETDQLDQFRCIDLDHFPSVRDL